MFLNRLKLNMDKTECIMFVILQQVAKLRFDRIDVCNETIHSAPTVWNLGVYLDKKN